MSDGVAMHDRKLAAESIIDNRRDAVIQVHIVDGPGAVPVAVDQSRQNEFAVGLDDLRVWRIRGLTFARDADDLIACDDNHRVANRSAAIAVNQRAALDHQTGWRRSR